MAANILVRDVTISPNPVQAKGKYTISVSIEELKGVAFVGNYVGSYVNISDKEILINCHWHTLAITPKDRRR